MKGIGRTMMMAASIIGTGVSIIGRGIDLGPPTIPSSLKARRRRAMPEYVGGHTNTTWHPQHGQRERERRMRQIARGQLREQNGLVR